MKSVSLPNAMENGEYETVSEFEVIHFSRFSIAARTTLFQRRMLTSCTRLQPLKEK